VTGDEVTLVSEGDPVICHRVQTCGTCRYCRLEEDIYCEDSAFPVANSPRTIIIHLIGLSVFMLGAALLGPTALGGEPAIFIGGSG
jgi:threonine dehydrogenase-like Zn-dependent dehydrogenase